MGCLQQAISELCRNKTTIIKATYKIIGLLLMIISVFFITSGAFLKSEYINTVIKILLTYSGIVLFIIGFILLKVIKTEDL